MTAGAESNVRFTEEDLNLFSNASGDRNPLHLSASYASKTAYGRQVVFGALGAVACLGHVRKSASQSIARLVADFHRPMFLDVDYQVRISEHSESTVVRLFDGSVPILTLAATLTIGNTRENDAVPVAPLFELTTAAHRREADIVAGLSINGHWRADPAALATLCQRWRLESHRFAAETLLWASYLIGMELPGRNALFFRFLLHFEATAACSEPLMYEARVSSMNHQILQMKIQVTLSSEGKQVASGQFVSFIRSELTPLPAAVLAAGTSVSDALQGKVGLVIGASRGLGAATVAALAGQSASVIAVSRSSPPDFRTALPPEAANRITAIRGDAASVAWLADLRDEIRSTHGRLDYLICNAFPAIPAFRLEPNAFSRIGAYMTEAVDLVLAPLCAFLDLLNETGGCAVIVSSSAVKKPVREWPHYVAAKNAVEALARVAPLQYPRISSLIVRPERLLTEMTNTPLGRQNALPPAEMAAEILARLQNPPAPGVTQVFSSADRISRSDA